MKKLQIHCIQHEAHEGLGFITRWIQKKNHRLNITCMHEGDSLPTIDSFDWLILMGGSMSVNDEDQYPWLRHEKILIRQAIESGKKVLGICLGAQLIASSMHARVYKNTVPELGWYPIQLLSQSSHPSFAGKENNLLFTFQWHSETFDLPDGAELLAQSKLCKNQAFMLNNKVVALQFHPEMSTESIMVMIENDGELLHHTNLKQTVEEMMTLAKNHLPANHTFLTDLLHHIAEAE